MSGLMNTGMAPAEESTNVSPEEQGQYDSFVNNGMTAIYQENTMPALLQSISGASNPVEGLANALVMVVGRLEDSAKQSGKQISGEVMMHGATEIAEGLVELAESAGIHEYSESDMESAYYAAIDQYRAQKQQKGEINDQEMQQEFQMLQQADQAGQLGPMMGIEA